MDYMEVIAQRQSCRAYQAEQISKEELTTILEAANAAPVGNRRYEDVKLTVIQNKEILARIDEAGAHFIQQPDSHPLYGAPTVILVSVAASDPARSSVGFSNAACIVENMSLAATGLGLGSVYLMGAIFAISKDKELCAQLKVPEGFIPASAVAVGKPAGQLEDRELTTAKFVTEYVL